MTIQRQAALHVVKIITLGFTVGALTTVAINLLGLATVGLVFTVGLMIYFVKMAYDIKVQQLTWEREKIERALKDAKS